jgi:cyanophycin synthetase
MQILERRAYVGPNLYAHFPVVRLLVDLEALEEHPSAKMDGFVDGLLELLPGLNKHGCSYGCEGGFVRRLKEDGGTWMGHVLEHVAIELQVLTGAKVSFGKTRSTEKPGHYHVVFEYEEENVGLEAVDLAHKIIETLLPPKMRSGVLEETFDAKTEIRSLIDYAQKRQLGPSTASLVRAAEDRGIPWFRLNSRSLIQLGHGKYQKRIQATITSATSHIGVELASDKEETNRLLGDLGLPVPRQRWVRNENEAVRAAEKLQYPVVIKPLDANHGRGVTTDVRDAEGAKVAYAKAREHSRNVLVESFLSGYDHRMLVVGGELIAVAKRVPGHVMGDGKHTVTELVEKVNADPRRGYGHENVLTRLEIDHEALRMLERKSYTAESVPKEGEEVLLRGTGNLSTGGTAIDLTDSVHPDNKEMAIRAARAIGLDVIGVDFITPDITQSYRDVGGGICEVNAAPGFRMHVAPTEGTPRDVGTAVIEMLFPRAPGVDPAVASARIPIAALTGTNGKTTTARMLAHIHKMNGGTVGLTTTDGVYVDGTRTVAGDMTGPKAARMVLSDPTVDIAVLETARGGLLRAGMGYRHCDVGAVLNVTSDHLGLHGIDTLEQLAQLKRIVVEVARDTAILNADDALCLNMADHTEASRIGYVTMNPRHELVRQHIQAGGLAMVCEDGINGQMITLYDKGAHTPLLWTHLIPATLEGKATHNVQNAMFAAIMAHAQGVKADTIRMGLRTFDTTYFQAPGRLNVFDSLPFKVILDYGHNVAALEAMCSLVGKLEVTGQRTLLIGAPGDRRDEDILAMCRVVAKSFDRFVVREDDDLRGREPKVVADLLIRGLRDAGVHDRQIETHIEEERAIEFAMRTSARGDLLLVLADKVNRCWKQITKFKTDPDAPAQRTKSDAPPAPRTMDASITLVGFSVVKDERGVRLARDTNAED